MNYEDIIHLPHPVSTRYGTMSNRERAAQFAPFAALTGYEAELAETARLTESQIELTEGEQQRLNAIYCQLQAESVSHPMAQLTYFQPDKKKAGGAYITLTAPVKKIDEYTQSIILATGESIPMANILTITLKK